MILMEMKMTDLEKRGAFEAWLFSTEKFKTRNKNFLFMLDEYGNYEDIPVLEHWETWQASANREGYKLVPVEINNEIESAMFSSVARGEMPCDIYKAMIGAQESKG